MIALGVSLGSCDVDVTNSGRVDGIVFSGGAWVPILKTMEERRER